MVGRIRYDTETRKWFERNWDRETTVMRCECCGLYYKPALGHKCKQKCK